MILEFGTGVETVELVDIKCTFSVCTRLSMGVAYIVSDYIDGCSKFSVV